MKEDVKKIYDAFAGKLVGTKHMKNFVCETLSFMPKKIIKRVTSNCWFMSSMDDAWAFTFTGNDLADQHLIFLSDDLMRESASQIRYSIAHEIGHVILNHRNSVLERQTKEEVDEQEKEADRFAKQFVAEAI